MKDKITIGLFIDTFFPMVDGVCMVVDNYAKRLVKYANVIVFAPGYSDIKYDDTKFPYKVVRCKSIKLPIIDYSMPVQNLDRTFMNEVNKYKLDIVHIHSPFMIGKTGVRYAKRNHVPVIGTMHSQYKMDFKRAVKSDRLATVFNNKLIRVFNKCDECWAVNSEVARIYHEEYGYKTTPKVMNNATDMRPVDNIEKACSLINKKHGIKKDEKVFLFVGRINKLKNVFFIAESLKILKDMNEDIKFKMIYVGTGQDEEKLKEFIEKNNMKNEIIMPGKITDRELLASYYKRADLFLFPSLYDASSIVQIEAASQKTPSLFIEGAATTATIIDGENGFLAKNDTEEYAKKIIKIMKNKELYESVCENCYKDLYKNWDDTIEEVYNRYISLIIDNNRKNPFLY